LAVVIDRNRSARRGRALLVRLVQSLGRHVVQLATGRFGRLVGLVVIVVAARVWLGVWPAAVLGAAVSTVGLVVGWAAVERRAPAVRRELGRPVVLVDGASARGRVEGEAGHVAFARGLAGLSAWYLAECERQESQR
jgi:hypothetical protein